MVGDLILTNVTLTADDLSKLLAQIINGLNQSAKDPSQYEQVSSLDGISSLPVFHQSGSVFNLVRVAISLLKGVDGKDIEMQVNADNTYIQYRIKDAASWTNLIAVADLKKPATDAATALKNMTYTYDQGILTININYDA